MRETMLQHFQSFSFENKLFQSLKHELRQEARHAGEVVDDLGDRETDKTVWLWLQRVARMGKHNVIHKTKTWFAPFTAMKDGIDQHYAYLYIFCIVSESQGHLKRDEFPVNEKLPASLVEVMPNPIETRKKDREKTRRSD